jgi:solute carrier family 35 protein F5
MPSSDGLGRRRASHGAVSLATSDGRAPAVGFREGLGLAGIARRTLGISFLLLTVFLWTLSNFLASVRSTSI